MSDEGKSRDRRQSILAAAEKVFDSCGYAAATIDAVAEEAGIAKGSVYNYFQSKQDLFTQVLTASIAVDEADTEELLGKGDLLARDKMVQFLENWFVRLGHYKRIGSLVLECWAVAAREDEQGVLSQVLREMYSRWRDRMSAIVRQGIESGEFDPEINPETAAAMIVSAANGLTVQAILNVGVDIDKEVLATFQRAVLAGLSVGRGPAIRGVLQ